MKKKISTQLALIISLLSLIVSIFVATLIFFQYFQNQMEVLSVDVKCHANDGQIKLTEYSDINNVGKVIQIPWRVVISNIGNKKISVIECNIESIHLPNEDRKETIYYGVNGGLFNINGEAVEYPIALDEGESRIFTAYIGILTTKKVYETLNENFSVNKIFMTAANIALGSIHTDIFGNDAKLYELENDDFYLVVDPKNRRAPSFIFELTTGKKNRFATIVSEYIN